MISTRITSIEHNHSNDSYLEYSNYSRIASEITPTREEERERKRDDTKTQTTYYTNCTDTKKNSH